MKTKVQQFIPIRNSFADVRLLQILMSCIVFVLLMLPCFANAQAIRTPKGKIFSTSNGKIIVAKMNGVSVINTLAKSLDESIVPVSGIIKAEVNSTVTDRGIVWSATDSNPTLENKLGSKSAGTGTGTFTCDITGVSPGIKYVARAYAKVDGATRYGLPLTFSIPSSTFVCGTSLAVDHKMERGVAPEAKQVDYGTVEINSGGSAQCWITQNLGASVQANSSGDSNKQAVGWFWQFNKKQGYFNDDKDSRQPQIAWISSVNELVDWDQDKDPCSIELGDGWRIPTQSEWESVQTRWTNIDGAYSVLKIHATGYFDVSGNYSTDPNGFFWSSTQKDGNGGYSCKINAATNVFEQNKAAGLSVRCLKDNPPPPFIKCGDKLTIIHRSGSVAPETKQVVYETVGTNFWGGNQCWITQNLGARQQAISETDANENAAGWYWQFNRKQGYRSSGTTTPEWNTNAISENCDWSPENDPCMLELGSAWRIPTDSEWNEISADWINPGEAYDSDLKLHAAGKLNNSNGGLEHQGADGYYWSITRQGSAMLGAAYAVTTNPSTTALSTANKNEGFSLRCIISSPPPAAFTKCGDLLLVQHKTDGLVAPENKRIYYKTVETNLNGNTACWIAQNLGASRQPASATDLDEKASGWHWQFNRKQGYNNALLSLWNTTPNVENSNWQPANDPCTLELGFGWRMPSKEELEVLKNTVTNFNGVYNSALKLYPLGWRIAADGQLSGDEGLLWSSNQSNSSSGYAFSMSFYSSPITAYDKTRGHSIRCLKENPIPVFSKCGEALTVVHRAGAVAPETQRIAYGTTEVNFWGGTHCMITQNLGAIRQATSASDMNEKAAGWYWQFNRKQGFQSILVPNMIGGSIRQNSDWQDINDPCSLELGSDWRIPTYMEWNEISSAWANSADAFNSVLKLHSAGVLSASSGLLQRGQSGSYWSGNQYISSAYSGAYGLTMNSSFNLPTSFAKSFGYTLRCIRFSPLPSFTTCGDVLTINHDKTKGIAPESRTIYYKTVHTGGKCWITQNLGATFQKYLDSSLPEYALGWYWQFNEKQGFKQTPGASWTIYSISDDSEWDSLNDPCTGELGTGWRIPTPTEWSGITAGWNAQSALESSLNLQVGGFLDPGMLFYVTNKGQKGYYWSNTQANNSEAHFFHLVTDTSSIEQGNKAWGLSVRCIKD